MTRNYSTSIYLTLLLPFTALLLHAFYYYPYFVDDSFITLRYAQRFIEGKGLTWNDGEYVEGYSNFLWLMANAALGYIGFDMVMASRVLGIISSFFTMAAIVRFQQRIAPEAHYLAVVANMMLACSGSVAIWSIAGLEATSVMALLAWAYVFSLDLLKKLDMHTTCKTGLLLGLVCLSRPEGAIFTILIAGCLLICSKHPIKELQKNLFVLCLIPFIFFAALLAFRLSYYGEFLPNTFYAKVVLDGPERFLDGLTYIGGALIIYLPVLLIPLLCIDKIIRRTDSMQRRILSFLFIICLVWIAVFTISGGDIFPGFRHLLPILPAIIMIVMLAMQLMDKQSVWKDACFYSAVIAGLLWVQTGSAHNIDAKKELWMWDAKQIGEILKQRYKDSAEKPLIAVGVAGAIPYYSELPTLDIFGLNDHYLAHNWQSTKYRGQGYLANELFNIDYIKQRNPDILIFNIPTIPDVCRPTFNDCGDLRDNYCRHELGLSHTSVEIWIRKDSKFAKYPGSQPSAHCSQ